MSESFLPQEPGVAKQSVTPIQDTAQLLFNRHKNFEADLERDTDILFAERYGNVAEREPMDTMGYLFKVLGTTAADHQRVIDACEPFFQSHFTGKSMTRLNVLEMVLTTYLRQQQAAGIIPKYTFSSIDDAIGQLTDAVRNRLPYDYYALSDSLIDKYNAIFRDKCRKDLQDADPLDVETVFAKLQDFSDTDFQSKSDFEYYASEYAKTRKTHKEFFYVSMLLKHLQESLNTIDLGKYLQGAVSSRDEMAETLQWIVDTYLRQPIKEKLSSERQNYKDTRLFHVELQNMPRLKCAFEILINNEEYHYIFQKKLFGELSIQKTVLESRQLTEQAARLHLFPLHPKKLRATFESIREKITGITEVERGLQKKLDQWNLTADQVRDLKNLLRHFDNVVQSWDIGATYMHTAVTEEQRDHGLYLMYEAQTSALEVQKMLPYFEVMLQHGALRLPENMHFDSLEAFQLQKGADLMLLRENISRIGLLKENNDTTL